MKGRMKALGGSQEVFTCLAVGGTQHLWDEGGKGVQGTCLAMGCHPDLTIPYSTHAQTFVGLQANL